ncbi:MAG: ribulose-phosphate 3-epimerase [Calditrichaeota bacterium]|nr:ribulose-phosphate 3-epimerase [Calditrichota bacterium]
MVKIAPSVLSADFSNLTEQVGLAEKGGADYIHLDIMDGHFVPNITFGPIVVKSIRKITDLTLDVHLMIENADHYLKAFREAGADILTVHYEACTHLWRTIDTIHELGAKAGVTLNPATAINLLDPVLEKIEMVLVMTVEPGFGGQKFTPEMIEKVTYLSHVKNEKGLDFDIEVDGGIDVETAPQVVQAGANVLVAGSSIFGKKDIGSAIKDLRKAADSVLNPQIMV